VVQAQMEHLGRRRGAPLLSIFQKYLTGHPKGAAAAWMLNGLCQSLLSGKVPGNRNADNVDPELRKFDHILYSSKTIQTSELRAGILKSFGFGQAGAEILIIHPDYLFASLDDVSYNGYAQRREARTEQAYKHFQNVLTQKTSMMKIKTSPPYSEHDEMRVFLDPTARASYDKKAGTWQFKPSSKSGVVPQAPVSQAPINVTPSPKICPAVLPSGGAVPSSTRLEVTLREAAEGLRQQGDKGVGLDCEELANIHIDDESFVERNFTSAEIAYCKSAGTEAEIRAKFTGRWAAKEAVLKAISNSSPDSRHLWKGSAAPMKAIEILPSPSGSPVVLLHDHAKEVSTVLGIKDIKVTITHCAGYAISQAIAL